MKNYKFVFGLFLTSLLAGSAPAATITQNFDSSWTAPADPSGGPGSAAMWQYLNYLPWDASQGVLTSVDITTSMSGVRDGADAVSYRSALFTGWSPNQYQFYDAGTIAPGGATFAATRSFTSGTDFPLANFLSYLYLPQAYFYFESSSSAAHTIDATTELRYHFDAAEGVAEPATEALLLAALSALAIAVRRQSKV